MKPLYAKTILLQTISKMESDPSPFVNRPGIDFIRNRKCPMSSVIRCILSMEAHSLTSEIRSFFKGASPPTKSAFVQQRDKLNEQAFPHLFSQFNKMAPFSKTYKGYHLLACDGSDVNIPALKDDNSTYVQSNTKGVGYHQIHLNALYDLLEKRYADIYIQPRAIVDEREAFCTFLSRDTIQQKSLFICDRGYFSMNVLARLCLSKHSFVLRMIAPKSKNTFLRRFNLPESEQFDISISFCASRNYKKSLSEHGIPHIHLRPDRPFDLIPVDDHFSSREFSLRLIKLSLSDNKGTENCEYLLTNLSSKTFRLEDIRYIYGLRWGIETSFCHLKYNVGLSYFHSIKRSSIFQEVYARVILYNLTMLLASGISPPRKDTQYEYKVSIADAVITARMFLNNCISVANLKELLHRYLTPVRPGRASPRKIRSKRVFSLHNRV